MFFQDRVASHAKCSRKRAGGPAGLCLFRNPPHSGFVAVKECSQLSPEELGWNMVHREGQRSLQGDPLCFSSQWATKKGGRGKEREKKGLGGWVREQRVGGGLTE